MSSTAKDIFTVVFVPGRDNIRLRYGIGAGLVQRHGRDRWTTRRFVTSADSGRVFERIDRRCVKRATSLSGLMVRQQKFRNRYRVCRFRYLTGKSGACILCTGVLRPDVLSFTVEGVETGCVSSSFTQTALCYKTDTACVQVRIPAKTVLK